MSNDTQAIGRLFKLQAKINMMVLDGARDAESVADALQQILVEKREYTRHLETVTLAPTKGSVTLAEAEDVFTGWLDGGFREWGTNVPGKDTNETAVEVHEIIRNGTFQILFESLGDPRQLCLTQGQIVEYCRNHRNSFRQKCRGKFFLFEVKGELFVANVYVIVGGLRADVCRFRSDYVLRADVVVKQQTI